MPPDVQTLNIAALSALKDVAAPDTGLEWQHVDEPAQVRWRSEVPAVIDRQSYAPVLEVHLVPAGADPMLASRFAAVANGLVRTGRSSEFFSDRDRLVIDSDATTAWAWTPDSLGAGVGSGQRRTHGYRGIYLLRTGQVSAFEALPTDSMGALVDEADLSRRSRRLLTLASEQVPNGQVFLAAALVPLDQLFEGDPADVVGRSSGTLRNRQGLSATMASTLAVNVERLRTHAAEVGREVAAPLLMELRAAQR